MLALKHLHGMHILHRYARPPAGLCERRVSCMSVVHELLSGEAWGWWSQRHQAGQHLHE
jgi:hypothetical protein